MMVTMFCYFFLGKEKEFWGVGRGVASLWVKAEDSRRADLDLDSVEPPQNAVF